MKILPHTPDADRGPTWEIREGDCLDYLKAMPAGSVQTCITSPPYWGLRDYGTAAWDGGNADCDHKKPGATKKFGNPEFNEGRPSREATDTAGYRDTCGKCGATRIDSQLGLEPTPEEYVANLVAVFREVHRVLRDDGTAWINLGDSYASGDTPGLKAKDLVGIPWMVAKALQAPYYTGTIKDERDRIWLAAMIDAEGCMFIHRRKAGQSNGQGYHRKADSFGAGLEVSSTDRVIVERCLAITGLGSICEQSPEQNPRRKQTIYRWNLRSNACRGVVREIYPHLTAKHHEARLLCGCPSSGEQARVAWETLKSIHQGGDHPDIDFPAPGSMFERGWFLRSDIIWAKLLPNPMPESVTDRPTKAHEYLFLLTKSARYFYDAPAVREKATPDHHRNVDSAHYEAPGQVPHRGLKRRTIRPGIDSNGGGQGNGAMSYPLDSRNKRSVWTVATHPYSEAHFATFPPKLVEPCVLAGAKAGDTILDPFSGAGTTGLVALRHDRSYIGLELNPTYAEMSRNRIRDEAPMFNVPAEVVKE